MTTARLSLPAFDEAHQPSGRTAPPREDSLVRSRLVTPLSFLFLLGTLDVLLTIKGLALGGRELNPYARLVMARGLVALVSLRLVTLGCATIAFFTLAPRAPRVARACVAIACLVFAFVDGFSVAQLVVQ